MLLHLNTGNTSQLVQVHICTLNNHFPLSNYLIWSDKDTEINETISLCNRGLIFVISSVSYLLVMRYLHRCACFFLFYHILCITYFAKEHGETLHVQISHLLSVRRERERDRASERESEKERLDLVSDDLPPQRRYLSSVLRLLSLMEQK